MEELINQLPAFLLIFMRVTSFFMTAPIFMQRTIPGPFKIGLGFFLAVITYLTLDTAVYIPLDISYFLYVMKEVFVGIALGFVASLILYAVQVAGGFIDFTMGFAIANVVDPQTGAQVPVIGNFLYMFALLFLVSVNAHHLMLDGVIRSYHFVPLDQLVIHVGTEPLAMFITKVFVLMFVIAFQLSIPVIGSIFLVTFALGIVARTVPQLNVFVVGMPINILLGFALLLVTMPLFFFLLQFLIEDMIMAMSDLLRLLGGI